MKRIRIGKDISMRWEITTDGVAIPLDGRDLTVEIKSPAGIENNIPYRIDGNILIMTYYGYEQKRTGEYSITLWEKKGKPGQNVVDVIRAFELVRTSQEENDFVGGDLQIESVDLGTENFDILTEGGYRAINIDTLQAEALEDSVNIKGKTYSNESFTITLPKANLDSAGVMSADDKHTLQEHGNRIAQINTTLDEHTESINARITTDRIADGAVTSEKIATSAFDSTLSVSGKIAPADVVGVKITELERKFNYEGDTQVVSMTDHVLNGYINATTGVIDSWSSSNYSIYKKQFTKDGIIRLQRNVASVKNANVIAIVDDPSIVVVGATLSQYIVDDGTTTPIDKEVEISAGQWLIVGYHIVESQRTAISFTEAIPINNAVKEIQQSVIKNTDNIAQNTNNIENGLFYHAEGSVLRVTNMILERAFIDSNGSVESWSTSTYNIYAMQFQAPTDIRIVKTGSVYHSDEVLCKCHTLNGMVVGGQIDGEVVCIGTDYPFEEVVHFDAGEYLVRSGGVTEYSTFTIIEKKSLMPYVRNLHGLKVDFEGDSVMEAKSTNEGWAALIQQSEGIIATNNGVSGSKITNTEGATSILQRILSRNPNDFDMIIVQGGFNDGGSPLGTFSRNDYRDEGAGDYDPATYYGALEIICRYCLKNFPKAGMIVGYNWGNNTWNTTLANAMIAVCEKWGMPYVDLRTKAGFNLHTETLRKKYGIYNGDVPVYNESKGYALDEKTKYEGKVYKANQVIASPAGAFNSSLWTYIGLEYDQCHCNLEGYKKSVGAIIQMMKAL